MLTQKLLKRATKTANSRENESRIAKQDSKKFPRTVETANGKPANGEGYLYTNTLNMLCFEYSSLIRVRTRIRGNSG